MSGLAIIDNGDGKPYLLIQAEGGKQFRVDVEPVVVPVKGVGK